MGRPRKTLYQFAIRDRTFLARRHAHLLEEEPLLDRPQRLRELQQAYRAEVSRLERAAIARQFERAVRQTPADLDAEALAEAFNALPIVIVPPPAPRTLTSKSTSLPSSVAMRN